MRASFSVLDQGWIPVITQGGKKETLGIREVLSRAPELLEISDPSPLAEFSVYRFLSVFLMDALRPQTPQDIRSIRSDGRFDMAKIEKYISQCMAEGATFDLFSEKRPFLQAEYDEKYDKEEKPVTVLDCMQASGNNHTHFCHPTAERKSITAAQCAVLLIVQSLFCTAQAQEYPSGVNASPPYFAIVNGVTLFDTLVNCFVPIASISIPFEKPCVIWRSSDPIIPKTKISSTSWLRGMIFPTRRIVLIPDENDNCVSKVYLSQGENFINKETWRDPAVCYRYLETGIAPLRPKQEKPLWRNFFDIADIPGGHSAQLISLFLNNSENADAVVTLYGVETSNASYISLMRNTLRVSKIVAENESKIMLIKTCIEASERLARALRHSLTDTEILKKSVADAAESNYYTACEHEFWYICQQLEIEEELAQIYINWIETIGKIAIKSNEDVLCALKLRGRNLAAAAERQKWLRYEIKKLKEVLE